MKTGFMLLVLFFIDAGRYLSIGGNRVFGFREIFW
jgi:hypothetical protein